MARAGRCCGRRLRLRAAEERPSAAFAPTRPVEGQPRGDVDAVQTRSGSGLIFLGLDGRPARLNTFTVAWRKALVAVDGPAGLRLHDLPHSYASALIQAGESVKTVQVRMGHASAMVTLDVYGHLWPDSEERTRAAVDAWLAAAADSMRTVQA